MPGDEPEPWILGTAPQQRTDVEAHAQSQLHLSKFPSVVSMPTPAVQQKVRIPIALQRETLNCYSALHSGHGYSFYRRVCELDGIKTG